MRGAERKFPKLGSLVDPLFFRNKADAEAFILATQSSFVASFIGGTMSQATTTKDHDEIRRWAEERGGRPSVVRTGGEGGILRFDFGEQEESLEEISWEEFFRIFDENDLAFLHQDEAGGGGTSRFFKFVSGETEAGSKRAAGGARRSSGRSAARGGSKSGTKRAARGGAKAPGGAAKSSKKTSKTAAKGGRKSAAKGGARTGSKAGAKRGSKSATKAGSKGAAKRGSKTGSKGAGKASAKRGAKSGAKTASKRGSKSSAKGGAKASARGGAKRAGKTASTPGGASKRGSKTGSRK